MVIHMGGAGQTFDEVVVGLGPAVSVVASEDPNWLLVCLEGGVPDLLQLDEDLIGGEGAPIAAVNIQLKELEVVNHSDVQGRLFFLWRSSQRSRASGPGCDRMRRSGSIGSCKEVSHPGIPLARSHCQSWS